MDLQAALDKCSFGALKGITAQALSLNRTNVGNGSTMQNPGGPTQIYRFTAAVERRATIEIPHTGANPTFTLNIQVIAP